MASRRRTWFLIRMTVYIAVVIVLYLNRGGLPWQSLTETLSRPADTDPTLTITGRDLAPNLIDRLVLHYKKDYPDLTINVNGGSTNQALEDLINGVASAAFLYRTPTADEQEMFRTIDGDTAIVVPVAVGGVLLVAPESADPIVLTQDDVKNLLAGNSNWLCERLYVPEPNEGVWDAIRSELDLSDPPSEDFIVFLADARAVIDAIKNDTNAWGLVSSLNSHLDVESVTPGLQIAAVVSDSTNVSALPTYENIATGDYPLHHYLYLACRDNNTREGGKFLTHLASARGLRQVERAGILPAQQYMRQIHLTTTPIGD